MYSVTHKTSVNIYWQNMPAENGSGSSSSNEQKIKDLKATELNNAQLLRACTAELKKPNITQQKITELKNEINVIESEQARIRTEGEILRSKRGIVIGGLTNAGRNIWNAIKDTARPMTMVVTNPTPKLEQAKIVTDRLIADRQIEIDKRKQAENDKVFLEKNTQLNRASVTVPITSDTKPIQPDISSDTPIKDTTTLASPSAIKVIEAKKEAVVAVKKTEDKTVVEKIATAESAKKEEKQKEEKQKADTMFNSMIGGLPVNEQKEFLDILQKGLTDEEEKLLATTDDDTILQKKLEIYAKIYTSFSQYVGVTMLEQFQKSKDENSPLAKEIQAHLATKNPERSPDAKITDTDLEGLKTDSAFLQIFIANPEKLQSYKVAGGTYPSIFGENFAPLARSVNSWYAENAKLIGTSKTHVAAKDNLKIAEKAHEDAIVQLDKTEQDIYAFHEDLNIKIAQLESGISSYDDAIQAFQICRENGQESSMSIGDIGSMELHKDKPMVCFDYNDTPVLYYVNKQGEHKMIMLFSPDNPITLSGTPSEIKEQMDMVVDLQGYPIVSNMIHTPGFLPKIAKACKEKYRDKNPMDPNNNILKIFILDCIYRATDIQDERVSSDTVDIQMNSLISNSEKMNSIIAMLHQKGLLDPSSGKMSDRFLTIPESCSPDWPI